MVAALPPYNIWPALWIGFPLFYFTLFSTDSSRSAFSMGWLFGFGYFVLGLSWTANALLVDGSTYSWVIPFAIAGLPALLAIFTGIASFLCRRLTDMKTMPGFLAFCGFISMAEWTRGHIFTGFPWNLYGYGWSGVSPMTQVASLFGAYGLTLLTILWGALPGFLIVRKASPRYIVFTLFIFYGSLAAFALWGKERLEANPTQYDRQLTLRIVQPSIPQSLKWNEEKAVENFQRIASLSKSDGFENDPGSTVLVIWPETAVTQAFMDAPDAQNELEDILTQYSSRVYLVAGLLRWEDRRGKTDYFNSIAVYDQKLNRIATYDKSHLVPFGEYIPFSKWLPANPLVAGDGFAAGEGPAELGVPQGKAPAIRFSPMICYEVIFPGAVIKKGSRPSFILNVTNDGWYGDSAGPRQHVEIARFRAIEEGLPLSRAANNGISAVIDSYGRYVWKSKLMEETASNIGLPQPASAPTLYSKMRDLPVLCAACLFIFIGFSTRLWRKQPYTYE